MAFQSSLQPAGPLACRFSKAQPPASSMAASNNNNQPIQHFADPYKHPLRPTQYRPDEAGLCNICLLKLAGLSSVTYGCYYCNIHLHSACARYFQETLSYFAHPGPAHALRLRRSPGRVCDICRGDCPPQSFVYSCTRCGFDVHPLCSMLPERVPSPLDPSRQLCMFSSESPAGSCSSCRHPLPRWHYIGGSSIKLHIACAIDTPTTGAAGQGRNSQRAAGVPVVYGAAGTGTAVQQGTHHGAASQHQQRSFFGAPAGPAGYNNYNPVIIQGYGGHAGGYYYGGGPAAMPGNGGGYGGGQQSVLHNPGSLVSVIARFLLGTAISALASDLLSELLSASFN